MNKISQFLILVGSLFFVFVGYLVFNTIPAETLNEEIIKLLSLNIIVYSLVFTISTYSIYVITMKRNVFKLIDKKRIIKEFFIYLGLISIIMGFTVNNVSEFLQEIPLILLFTVIATSFIKPDKKDNK